MSDPLIAIAETARAALLAAGLARCEAGESVYFTGGQGPVLVLLHGVNDHAGTWAPVVPELAKRFRLIVPDLPGHGESGPKSGPLPMPLMLERLHAIIEREAPAKVAVAGNSMGAWVSILYALEHPDRVERLFLESGGGLAIPPRVPLVATTREEAYQILRAVHGPGAAIPEWAADALTRPRDDSPLPRVLQSGLLPYFVDGRLDQVRVPTVVIWGSDDGVIDRAYVEKLVKGIPGAKLKVIEGAAHMPHAQQPGRFIECLTETC